MQSTFFKTAIFLAGLATGATAADSRYDDSLALVAISEANPGKIAWDYSTIIDTWDGLSLQNGRVVTTNLDSLHLITLPDEIGNLSNLSILSLRFNGLFTLPQGLLNLKSLTDINLNNNYLREESVLPNLYSFIDSNDADWRSTQRQFTGSRVTDSLVLVMLKPRNVSFNAGGRVIHIYIEETSPITSLPPEIGYLTELQNLAINETGIVTLPPEICNLTNLTSLLITEGVLKEFPPEIGCGIAPKKWTRD